MKPLEEILTSINAANDRYRFLKLSFISEQSEILRDLSCAFVDLIDHKKEARNSWLNVYNSTEGTNALKTRRADTEVREYDLIKGIMKAVQMQVDSVRSTISANKQQ